MYLLGGCLILSLKQMMLPTFLAHKSAHITECFSTRTSSYSSRAHLESRRDNTEGVLIHLTRTSLYRPVNIQRYHGARREPVCRPVSSSCTCTCIAIMLQVLVEYVLRKVSAQAGQDEWRQPITGATWSARDVWYMLAVLLHICVVQCE